MPSYLCLSSHALLIISSLLIKFNNKWLKHKLTCQNAYYRKDRYTLIEQSAILELLTVLLEHIDLSVIAIFISKNSYCLTKYSTYYASIMLNAFRHLLCS